MKEYGGYIEFESFRGNMLHEKALALNCGRNALAYLCEAKQIQKLYIPYFLCSSVPDLCDKIGVKYEYYHITENFEPIFKKGLGKNEWLYIVNFYGQLNNVTLEKWKNEYNHLIVDNAQSYYQFPVKDVDTLYTCRKYFGVADGAFLYTDALLTRELPIDESLERMHYLMGRFERNADEFYSEYVANNQSFASEPIKRMSKLTDNLLHGIDYEFTGIKRQENFNYLEKAFNGINKLNLTVPYGAFMYPLWIDSGEEIRKKLQKARIYIPTLWPNVLKNCSLNMLEHKLAADILPIPVDQRYSLDDMSYLVEAIRNVSFKRN